MDIINLSSFKEFLSDGQYPFECIYESISYAFQKVKWQIKNYWNIRPNYDSSRSIQ